MKLNLRAAGWGKWLILGSACALLFILLSQVLVSPVVKAIDQAIIQVFHEMENPTLTWWMKYITMIGSGYIIYYVALMIAVVLLILVKVRWELLLFGIVLIGSTLGNSLLKRLFSRERPDFNRLIEASGHSFPSGHSMTVCTFYSIMLYLLIRHIHSRAGRWALIGFSCLMIILTGISRVYLGVHYPSDIAGGYLASLTWVLICIAVYEAIFSRNRQNLA